MGEFLLELFSEEIPARMQKRAAEDLNRLIIEGLKNNALTFDSSFSHVTPHRLCVVIEGLISKQTNVREERRGPRVDAPDVAVEGFLKSLGLTRNDLEERETSRGKFLFAIIDNIGQETKDILPKIIDTAIRAMPWPKSMRWGRNSFKWVRPLHHILAVFDKEKLEGHLNLGDDILEYANMTKGHRFLAPQLFEVNSFSDYQEKLKKAFVVIDREERKSIIMERAQNLATAQGIKLKSDPSLLEEVCGLIEWPNPLIGKIQREFMTVPPEALVCAMRTHQKYFALTEKDGELAPNFITISNMSSNPKINETTINGNERVLSARLSDAKFFWDQDRAIKLSSRIPELATVKFYEKLGALSEKMVRVEKLGVYLSKWVPGTEKEDLKRAIQLAKADLTTAMVGEFPELQGIMGSYYAHNDGESKEVCQAIKEHYSPQGPSDLCPTAPLSIVVSLADKIDTLVGFFAINEKPTGSKDPFALRRYALSVIRLIRENSLRLPLEKVVAKALTLYPEFKNENGLIDFIMERLKVFLRTGGTGHDRISSIFAAGDDDDINRLINRIGALENFLSSDDGGNLLVAYRRAANIVAIESKKDRVSYTSKPDENLYQLKEEKAISEALAQILASLPNLIERQEFNKAAETLSTLRGSVDAYFENVTVNSSDPLVRANRLKTLNLIVRTMNTVADFSLIEVS
ncbi:glycine--tRNA ligase subunit beta [Alphaproteobacteria bacterium]|nr:glycine--tRNA ligase subunit beta [Alphaproteobacteria bacterium]